MTTLYPAPALARLTHADARAALTAAADATARATAAANIAHNIADALPDDWRTPAVREALSVAARAASARAWVEAAYEHAETLDAAPRRGGLERRHPDRVPGRRVRPGCVPHRPTGPGRLPSGR